MTADFPKTRIALAALVSGYFLIYIVSLATKAERRS
jgi:hypothetical protein